MEEKFKYLLLDIYTKKDYWNKILSYYSINFLVENVQQNFKF